MSEEKTKQEEIEVFTREDIYDECTPNWIHPDNWQDKFVLYDEYVIKLSALRLENEQLKASANYKTFIDLNSKVDELEARNGKLCRSNKVLMHEVEQLKKENKELKQIGEMKNE